MPSSEFDHPRALPEAVQQLCRQLSEAASELDRSQVWPEQQMQWLAEAGVFRWFIPRAFGGDEWSEVEILEGYLALSQACLTTTFILTQWNAACKRLTGSSNEELKARLLPQLASGECFTTVGISHLTTSRQHVGRPVLTATPQADGGFLLNGFSPWVTAAPAADVIVLGATCPDGTQLIAAVPTDLPGVSAHPGTELVALTGSCTDQVELHDVPLGKERIVAGPVENVMQTNSGGGTGGLQTSTLAVGLSLAATDFLRQQAERRSDLRSISDKLASDCAELRSALVALTTSASTPWTAPELRTQANSLALRSTQAALSAAKGAGFVATHPTGRWAREALFFLVWSCPQPVVAANLCELAQLSTP